METYETIPDNTPPPGCPAPCPILDDVTDLPYSLSVDEPDSRRWVITAEEKERIDHAAQFGPQAAKRVKDGDMEGWADLRALHVTRWYRAPREQP